MGWVGSGHTKWTHGQLCFVLIGCSELGRLVLNASHSNGSIHSGVRRTRELQFCPVREL